MSGNTEPDAEESSPLPDQGAALLLRLESTRTVLARQIVRDFPLISDPELDYLTISVLLRVIFLRFCRNYGLLEPGSLDVLATGDNIGKRLERICSDTGLLPDIFEYGPAASRQSFGLTGSSLREIIWDMNAPGDPALTADLSLEELAGVLDCFLGTRMQVTEGYRVIRSPKSALHYTGSIDVPSREVVRHTVSHALDYVASESRETRNDPIRILDPSCGAGLFLLATYRSLIRGKRISAKSETITDEPAGHLRASIYGTDIDPGSVSAARVVLLLAFIEAHCQDGDAPPRPEILATLSRSLIKNIRCGNALIAPDFFSGKPIFPFNAEERRRVNAFDWIDAFPFLAGSGGFDAVIGAPPPYRAFAVKAREEYFQTHYDTYSVSGGLYTYFIERGVRLLQPGGIIAVLVPGAFLRSGGARPLRHFLLGRQIAEIARTGKTRALQEGDQMIYLLILKNQPAKDPVLVSPEIVSGREDFLLDQDLLDDGGWKLEDTRAARILRKIEARGTRLDTYVMGEIGTGTYDDLNDPHIVDRSVRNRLIRKDPCARRFLVPLLGTREIRPYCPEKPSRFVITGGENPEKIHRCPALREFLEKTSTGRADDLIHHLGNPLHSMQRHPKIIFSLYTDAPAFVFDPRGIYAATQTLGIIHRNDPYLAGILNSSLGRFFLTHICRRTESGYHVDPESVGKFPVMVPDFDKRADKSRHDKLVSLVTHILELNRYLPLARSGQESRLVQQEIDLTAVRIDALVLELYGLMPDEIAFVEGSVRRRTG